MDQQRSPQGTENEVIIIVYVPGNSTTSQVNEMFQQQGEPNQAGNINYEISQHRAPSMGYVPNQNVHVHGNAVSQVNETYQQQGMSHQTQNSNYEISRAPSMADVSIQDAHVLMDAATQVNETYQHGAPYQTPNPNYEMSQGWVPSVAHVPMSHGTRVVRYSVAQLAEMLQQPDAPNQDHNTNYEVSQNGTPSMAYVPMSQDAHVHRNIASQVNEINQQREPSQDPSTNYDTNQDFESGMFYVLTNEGWRSLFSILSSLPSINDNSWDQNSSIGNLETQLNSYQNLENITIEEIAQGSEPVMCSICLVELSIGSTATRLPSPCSHIYHQDCIMRWLSRSNTCPMCRRSI